MDIALLVAGAVLFGVGVIFGVEIQRRVDTGKSPIPFASGKPKAVAMDNDESPADNYAEVRL